MRGRRRGRGRGGPSENESYRGEASETDRQTEIRKFIKIYGDSEPEREGGREGGEGGGWGWVNLFCDCQRADKWLRGKMQATRSK